MTTPEIANTPAPAATPPPADPAFFTPSTPAANTPAPVDENPYPVDDWRHSLSPEMRAEASLKVVNDIPTLAKNYVHAQKHMGSDKIVLPGKHATDADWEQVYDKLGRPALDKYEVSLPKEAKYVTPEDVKTLIPLAHKSGMLPKQLGSILEHYEKTQSDVQAANVEKLKTEISTTLKGLKDEWGQAFEQRKNWSTRFVTEHGGPEMLKFLQENPKVGFNPAFIRMAAKIGETLYKEDGINSGAPAAGFLAPAEAQNKINSILGDHKGPYYDSTHPGHKAALQEVTDLYSMVHPTVKQEA